MTSMKSSMRVSELDFLLRDSSPCDEADEAAQNVGRRFSLDMSCNPGCGIIQDGTVRKCTYQRSLPMISGLQDAFGYDTHRSHLEQALRNSASCSLVICCTASSRQGALEDFEM